MRMWLLLLLVATVVLTVAVESGWPGPDYEGMAKSDVRAMLKDPEPRFRDVTVSSSGVVCGYVNARNSMGGYTGWAGFQWGVESGLRMESPGLDVRFEPGWRATC